jgi:flavin reductase (DIM6/NTAB) family NADH-FMN oxidoreductase RutF
MGVDVHAPIADPSVVALQVTSPLWSRFFTVAPLVLIGTREGDGFDIAPKHMAMPLGWENFYGFVCSHRHATYRNALEHGSFTASFPDEELIVETGLAASGRLGDATKPALATLPTFPARVVDGVLVAGCALYLECELERVVDGFGPNSLVVGRVVAAAAREDVLRGGDVDDADLVSRAGVLAYLHPGRFATVRSSLAFPYPSDFTVE